MTVGEEVSEELHRSLGPSTSVAGRLRDILAGAGNLQASETIGLQHRYPGEGAEAEAAIDDWLEPNAVPVGAPHPEQQAAVSASEQHTFPKNFIEGGCPLVFTL